MKTRLSELLRIFAGSLICGGLVGLTGTGFRFFLARADQLRDLLVGEAHRGIALGLLELAVAVAACAALARWLVIRFAPIAAGSGVHHVEAVMRDEAEPVGPEVIPVKFFGGLLAIGSGLALGREGPTVQMGAALGTICARRFLPDLSDHKILNAAGAGAGLAVAFNAPIGGMIFVFEELKLGFAPSGVIATLGASAIAVAMMRLLLGNQQEFAVQLPQVQPIWQLSGFLFLGGMLGLIGALYNVLTTFFLSCADRWRGEASILPAAGVGAAIGLVAWFWPAIVGGGEELTQALLSGRLAANEIAFIFVARFVIGPFCYGAGTPGGLFAPLLAVGAAFGALFANIASVFLPAAGISTVGFAVVGMSALFTAIVRAPLTGIMLTIEMTGRADLALAMLAASLGAILVTTWCGSEPIYETLRKRMLAARAGPR